MNDRFLKACRGEPVDRTPVWFMRQAGRYMAEYRALREKHSILELIGEPELAAEVTLQPIRALGVDAAILFCDLLVILPPMGVAFDFVPTKGPQIEDPLRTRAQIDALKSFEPADELGHVLEAIRILRGELEVPLIGFAGAPFTLASYMIEGGSSRNYENAKGLMYNEPKAWHALSEKIVDVVSAFLLAQIDAGVQAVQVFDSWIGALSPTDYRELVFPHSRELLTRVSGKGVPVLHFGTGTATLLELLQEAGGDVIGVDWRVPLDQARARLGEATPVQGNLDPVLLLANREVLHARVREVIELNAGRPGHVFNLGHGILPPTPVESVRSVVELVHEITATQA